MFKKKFLFFSVMLKFESHEFIFLKITVAAYSDHFLLQLYLVLILSSKELHAFYLFFLSFLIVLQWNIMGNPKGIRLDF
jgi:hypothetical protein